MKLLKSLAIFGKALEVVAVILLIMSGIILERVSLMKKKLSEQKYFQNWGAAIAQWIRLHIPPVALGSSLKHTIYAVVNLCLNVSCGKDENKQTKKYLKH